MRNDKGRLGLNPGRPFAAAVLIPLYELKRLQRFSMGLRRTHWLSTGHQDGTPGSS